MPAISTTLYPTPGYVRVEANWADQSTATAAAVYRVDCLTGDRVPLRPYVAFSGDFLNLSCGYGIFWDTEAPLDRCVYYCTQATDTAGNLVTRPAPLVTDTFTRTVAGGWGTPDIGPSYTPLGAAADFSVNGTSGRIVTSSAGARRTIATGPIGTDMLAEGTIYPTVIPVGGIWDQGLAVQYSIATDTGYEALIRFNPSGQMDARINRVSSGSATILNTTLNIGTQASSGLGMRIKFLKWGNQLKMKAWDVTLPEPPAWIIEITDPAPLTVSGGVGGVSRAQTGLTLPITASWDNLLATDPCKSTQIVEACSDSLVVPSSGDFYLGDPVRPCNDVVLQFNASVDPDCVPTHGIFFGNMADETFAANTSSFLPVNSKYPIVANRTRRGVASTLTVATRTFADRDALRRLNEPNSPLLLRGPAQYGIPDRYMSVDDVDEMRPVSDHRVQPRAVSMPHFQVARPSGPSQGVCGTRVQDLCDIYSSWDSLAFAGLTWADLLRGKASRDTPQPVAPERTWNDVNSQYANWNAVQSGNTDWDDLLDGA